MLTEDSPTTYTFLLGSIIFNYKFYTLANTDNIDQQGLPVVRITVKQESREIYTSHYPLRKIELIDTIALKNYDTLTFDLNYRNDVGSRLEIIQLVVKLFPDLWIHCGNVKDDDEKFTSDLGITITTLKKEETIILVTEEGPSLKNLIMTASEINAHLVATLKQWNYWEDYCEEFGVHNFLP